MPVARWLLPLAVPDDEHDREELRDLLRTLGDDDTARTARIAVCEAIAVGLARVGQLLWVSGSSWTFAVAPPWTLEVAPPRVGVGVMVDVA